MMDRKAQNKKIKLALSVGLFAISSHALSKVETTYTVQKVGPLLEDVTIPISNASLSHNSDGTVTLDYRLPPELDGANARRFRPTGTKGTDGHWHLQETKTEVGTNGEPVTIIVAAATCSGDLDKNFTCEMSYGLESDGTFHIDKQGAAEYIAAQPSISPELAAKFEAAQETLSIEALGIVRSKRVHGGKNQ